MKTDLKKHLRNILLILVILGVTFVVSIFLQDILIVQEHKFS